MPGQRVRAGPQTSCCGCLITRRCSLVGATHGCATGWVTPGSKQLPFGPGLKEGRNWCCSPHCRLPRCLLVGCPSGCWAVGVCWREAALLSGGDGMFLVLCVCPVPGCLGVLGVCVMAVSGSLSFLLFSLACFEAMPLPCINKNHIIPFAWSLSSAVCVFVRAGEAVAG